MIGVRILKHLTNLQVFLRFYSVSKVPVTHVRNPREKEANEQYFLSHHSVEEQQETKKKNSRYHMWCVCLFMTKTHLSLMQRKSGIYRDNPLNVFLSGLKCQHGSEKPKY